MKRKTNSHGSSVALAALLIGVVHVSAAQVTIDFEDGFGAPGQTIGSNYLAYGVSFSNAAWLTPDLIGTLYPDHWVAGQVGLGALRGCYPTNTWIFPGLTNPITVGFAFPVTNVSIQAFDVGMNGARLRAYDATGKQVGNASSVVGIGIGSGNGPYTLSVTGTGIRRAVLDQYLFSSPNDGVAFDNLRFSPPGLAGPPKRLLVVSVADGYRHSCIETANQVFVQLARASGEFTVDFAQTDQQLSQKMSLSALGNYDGVVFQNTAGDLPLPNLTGFLAWIASGKGFLAVHAATAGYPTAGATLPSYPAYSAMLGAQMPGHIPNQLQVTVFNKDPQHPATRHFAASFQVLDEIYMFQNIHWEAIHELLGMKTNPTNGVAGDFPLAWCKAHGSGRVLATALGHREEVWQSTGFQQHLSGAIRWMLKLDRGNLPRLVVDQSGYPGGSFAAHFDGAAVETYWVQASSNLANWVSISTNTAPSNTTYRILDPGAGTFSRRFYRVFLP